MKPTSPAPFLRKGTETILLVEDSDTVRKLVADILGTDGYQVLAARDGEEAVNLLETHPASIHLLFTDVVLPRMGGRQIADHAARAKPGIKVLYTSGYTDRGIVENFVLEPGIAFLQKPFKPEDLLRKTREVLDRPR